MSKSNVYYFDIGNSRLKLWACHEGLLVAECSLPHEGRLADVFSRLPAEFTAKPAAVLGASVLSPEQELLFSQSCCLAWGCEPEFAKTGSEQCGVRNGYGQQAARLGIDRWLVLLGYDRAGLRENEVVCLADCGTAVTIDLLCRDGRHLGGYILPGIWMMQQALQKHTARVKNEAPELEGVSPGRNTNEAVMHGAMLALVSSLERVACQNGASLVLTGGDARRLGGMLTIAYREDPLLLLRGLQRYFANAGVS
jgi:type III pantothenate kinase